MRGRQHDQEQELWQKGGWEDRGAAGRGLRRGGNPPDPGVQQAQVRSVVRVGGLGVPDLLRPFL